MKRRRNTPAARAAAQVAWGLAIVGLLVGVLLIEGLLRVTGLHFPNFWRSEPVLGLGLNPGADGWYIDEGRARVHINSDGYRDRERTQAKPAGGYRALVLGDSFTESVQVPLEDTFEQVAERELAQCPALQGRPVEVLNFGVRGFGTVQELELLKLRGEGFSPDAIVLANDPETDLLDNLAAWDAPRGAPLLTENNARVDFTDAVDAARKTMESSLHDSHDEPFPGNLWLVQLFHAGVVHWQRRNFWRMGKGNDPLSPDYPARLVYAEPRDDHWRRAWALQDELLDLLSREAAEHSARAVLLLVSSPVQVFPDPAKRAEFLKLWGVDDLGYPDKRMTETATRLGIETVDTVPLLDAETARTHQPVHGFSNTPSGVGHWNSVGHRIAGHALAEKLCAMASAPPTPPAPEPKKKKRR